jgi:heme O synthase-like polyprenyltransferase
MVSGDEVDDEWSGSPARSERSTARKICSVVYLVATALLPAAAVVNLANGHWFFGFVAIVASVVLVPLAISVTRQSGPAARLIFPMAAVTVLGGLLVGAGLT